MSNANLKSEPLTLVEIIRRSMNVSDACCQALESITVRKEFEAHDMIVTQGEMAEDFVLSAEGLTRVVHYKKDKEDTVCFGSAGSVFIAFHSLWAREPAMYGLEALTDTVCYMIPVDKFRRLEEKYPELSRWLCQVLTEQMFSFEVLYHKMTLSTPEERLQTFWDFQSEKLRSMSAAKISQVVPLKMIAQYLGMTPQTLSKVRRKLVGL